jgi:hypothetical protein
MNINKYIINQLLLFTPALVPVTEIAQMPFRPPRFLYEQSRTYLDGQGKSINDFYFNKFTPFSWFVYYRDFVLIDIPAFNVKTLSAMYIAETIDLETIRLQSCLQKNDYPTFFSIVDPRIAVEAYLQLFHDIPDQDKYRLFWYTFSRSRLKLDDFSADFINSIQKYRTEELRLPYDEQGYIPVYRGHISNSPVSQASSWTLDINTAIYFSRCYQVNGRVFKGKVHKNRVLANLKYRNEKEIICFPGSIEEIEEMKLLSFTQIKPDLEASGLINLYHQYGKHLNPDYFHKPGGIHGLSHTRRVLLLSLILSWMENLSAKDRDLLCQAAVYHDIGRCNDNFDPEHGRESYRKLQHYQLVNLESEEQEILRFIIENHSISDRQAAELVNDYKVKDYHRLLALYHVFKDADGLDRIRINDLDVKQLRTPSAHKLLLVARELLERIQY